MLPYWETIKADKDTMVGIFILECRLKEKQPPAGTRSMNLIMKNRGGQKSFNLDHLHNGFYHNLEIIKMVYHVAIDGCQRRIRSYMECRHILEPPLNYKNQKIAD